VNTTQKYKQMKLYREELNSTSCGTMMASQIDRSVVPLDESIIEFSYDDNDDDLETQIERKINGEDDHIIGSNEQDEDEQIEAPVRAHSVRIGGNETNDVRRGRIIVITLLLLSALSAGFFFWSLRRSERNLFRATFNDDALKLSESLFSGVMNTFASLDLLSTVMVSHARTANDSWPFTTLPHFPIVAAKTLSMSAAVSVAATMLIDGAYQRKQWEKYAWKYGRSLVNETLHIMQTDFNYFGEIPWNVPLTYSVHDDYNPIPYNQS
jgi:hypothetical protein